MSREKPALAAESQPQAAIVMRIELLPTHALAAARSFALERIIRTQSEGYASRPCSDEAAIPYYARWSGGFTPSTSSRSSCARLAQTKSGIDRMRLLPLEAHYVHLYPVAVAGQSGCANAGGAADAPDVRTSDC